MALDKLPHAASLTRHARMRISGPAELRGMALVLPMTPPTPRSVSHSLVGAGLNKNDPGAAPALFRQLRKAWPGLRFSASTGIFQYG